MGIATHLYFSGGKFMKNENDSDEDSMFGDFNPNLKTKENRSNFESSNKYTFNKGDNSTHETSSKRTSLL